MSEAAKLSVHAACALLPRMGKDAFASLVADIRRHGLFDPIILLDGEILDGRHRYLACLEAGVEPRFKSAMAGINPFLFAWSRNGERRHWGSQEQKVAAFKRLREAADAFDEARRQTQAAGNEARREKAKAQPRDAGGEFDRPTGGASIRGTTRPNRSTAKLAKDLGVSRAAVERVETLSRVDEDALNAVANGETSYTAAARQLRENKAKALLQQPAPDSSPGLHLGDFRAATIAAESVQLVFIDPPYDRDSVALYGEAARVAAHCLRPGGSLVCYVGQSILPDVLPLMSQHLRYWWTCAVLHEAAGKARMQKLGIVNDWKPLLWFVKGTRGDVQTFIGDVVSGGREKDHHPWQQAESEAAHFIANLTSADGLVADFFAGGGTTLVAARRLGRPYLGFEIDPNHFNRASARLSESAAA